MTYIQFKYVVEVSKTGSINQAAKNLFISQSVLSTSIKSLETELKQPIFVRSNKGISLTTFGKTFLSYITPVNLQLEQLNTLIFRSAGSYSVSFSVASNGFHYINDFLAALYKKYCSVGIRLESYEGYGNEAVELISNQTADVGVVRYWSCYRNMNMKQISSQKLMYYPIATMDVGVSLGENNPLFYSKSNYITPDMLKDYPPILYEYIDSGPYADILNRLKIPSSKNRFVVSSRAVQYELLGHTNAYFLNSSNIDNTEPRIHNFPYPQRFLRFADCNIRSEIGWICRSGYTLTPVATEFLTMLTNYLTNDTLPAL